MNQNLKRHTCRVCNFSTSRKFNLVRHFQRKHQNQSTFNGYAQRETRKGVQCGSGSHTSQYGYGVQAAAESKEKS